MPIKLRKKKMNEQLTQIYDMAYAVLNDEVRIEQKNCGETDLVILHRIHVKLLAEEMGLTAPDNTAHMSEVVEAEISELFWGLEDHLQSVCNDKHMDPDHMVEARNLYNKLYSICRLIGLDPESLSNLESNEVETTPTASKSPVSPSEAPSKGANLNTLKPNQAALI